MRSRRAHLSRLRAGKRGGALVLSNRLRSLAKRRGRLAFRGLERPLECCEFAKATVFGNKGERKLGAGQQSPGFIKLAVQNRCPRCLAGGSPEPPDENRLCYLLSFFHYSLHAKTLARVLVDVTHSGGDVAVIGGTFQLLNQEDTRASETVYATGRKSLYILCKSC